jgi:hypothetical protein
VPAGVRPVSGRTANRARAFSLNELIRGSVLRKFALGTSVGTVLLFATFCRGQQTDIAVGVGTTLSSKTNTASQAFLPPAEKGGTYPSVSFDHIFKNRFGFNAEVAVRGRKELYNGYQDFRPIFYDVNALFAPRVGENVAAELMAGVGIASAHFYTQFAICNPFYASGCVTNLTSNHFMEHVGGGVRYYFWHNFFVRPEAHVYFIRNNTQFSSNYVGRVGASIGYTFGSR